MQWCTFRDFAAAIAALWLFAGAAHAQAPIVYAGQGAPARGEPLAGGGENSYGYGGSQRRAGAAIDIRRDAPQGATAAAPAPASAPEPAPATPAAPVSRPDWLERERVGPPYQANGRWYVPTPEPGYSETGIASWYGPGFQGQRAANGEVFDQEGLTAAHPTLPLNSLVQVTNLENGREVIVRITDRGPFVGERLIDLSRRSAEVLGFEAQGRTRVHVRYLGPAPRRIEASGAPAPAAAAGPTSLLPPPEPTPAPAAETPAPPAEGSYYVQVGAFSDLANAHRVRDAASSAGAAAIDVRRSSLGAELFRVRVGPWETRAQAEAARQTLASMGYGESVVAGR